MEEFRKNRVENLHIHIHTNEKKLDEILEAITQMNNDKLDYLIKKIKATTKDLKSTPTK